MNFFMWRKRHSESKLDEGREKGEGGREEADTRFRVCFVSFLFVDSHQELWHFGFNMVALWSFRK